MSVVCLYFPRLAVELARQHRTNLWGRPLVFVDGVGGEARVVQRSAEAASRGVLVGMRASEARMRAAGAAFLPHRPEEHGRVLADLAGELSRATGLPVSVGADALFVPLPQGALQAGERAYVRNLLASVELSVPFTASVATGESAEQALIAARLEARRGSGREVRSA